MRCEKCGIDYNPQLDRCPSCGASAAHGGKTEFYGRAVNSKVGIIDFFNGMFSKHPKGTATKLFMSGTPETTPRADQMLAQWQKPWLFFRLLIIGFIFILLCGVMIYMEQPAGYITLWTMGSLIIPLTILTFYWEINIPRDIPIYTVIGVFFIGGAISLVVTFIMSAVINSEYGQFVWFAPVYEEPAKLLAAVIFIKKINTKYGFGGILLGGAVGAGFATFENIMYVINYYVAGTAAAVAGQAIDPTALAMELFIMRSLLSFGGHTIWAAMYCGALVLEKGDKPLSVTHFFKKRFLIYFGAAFGLHFLWNSSLGIWVNVILMVVGLVVLFSIIRTCLVQVVQTAEMARFNANVPPVSIASGAQPQVQQSVQSPYLAPQQNTMLQQNFAPRQNVVPQNDQRYVNLHITSTSGLAAVDSTASGITTASFSVTDIFDGNMNVSMSATMNAYDSAFNFTASGTVTLVDLDTCFRIISEFDDLVTSANSATDSNRQPFTCTGCKGSLKCQHCDGDGTCSACLGLVDHCISCGGSDKCQYCGGTGTCHYCNGTGVMY